MFPKDYTTSKCLRLMCLYSYTARLYNIVIVHCCIARGCLERVNLLQSVESMKQHYGSFTIPAGTGSRETDFMSHHPIIKLTWTQSHQLQNCIQNTPRPHLKIQPIEENKGCSGCLKKLSFYRIVNLHTGVPPATGNGNPQDCQPQDCRRDSSMKSWGWPLPVAGGTPVCKLTIR